jgi:hypothetical protein
MFEPQNKTWCATKVDEAGKYIEGAWGFCHGTCQLDLNGTSKNYCPQEKIICRLVD